MEALLLEHNDALRAVLVRVCASDHPSLRLTCRRFREVLDSPEFRQERCESGHAEIQAVLWTPFQLYKHGNEEDASESDSFFQEYYDDFGYKDPAEGYQQNRANILVDGRKAGEASFTLLPRNKPHLNFHSMADAVSQDLQSTACLFFDRNGKPRLKSIQQALIGSNDNGASFLYLESFKLNDPAHRTTSWTGARALRSLLTTLKDRWSIAIYIPEAEAQFSKDDEKMSQKQRFYDRDFTVARITGQIVEESKEKKKEVKDWQDRCDALTKQDMRQFFQAGFEQAKDAVHDSSCFHLFIVPSSTERPMLTDDETISILIAEAHPAKEAPSGDALRLLEFMKTSCTERDQIMDQISRSEEMLDSPEDHPVFRHVTEPVRAESQRCIETAQNQIQHLQRNNDQIAAILNILNDDSHADLIRQIVAQAAESLSIESLVGTDSAESFTRESFVEYLNSLNAENDAMIARCRRALDEDVPRLLQQCQEAEQSTLEVLSQQAREDISKHQQTLREQDTRVHSKVAEFVAASGPDIVCTSDALHACAYNLEPEYIKTLMSFVPDNKKHEAINGFDQNGYTVLMTAAASGHYNASSIGNRLTTCEAVIELGADKNIRNASGLTALGIFRRSDRNSRDFYGSFGMADSRNPNFVAMNSASPAMEALLRPWGGATSADDAFLEANDEDDDEELNEQEDFVDNEDSDMDEEDDE